MTDLRYSQIDELARRLARRVLDDPRNERLQRVTAAVYARLAPEYFARRARGRKLYVSYFRSDGG